MKSDFFSSPLQPPLRTTIDFLKREIVGIRTLQKQFYSRPKTREQYNLRGNIPDFRETALAMPQTILTQTVKLLLFSNSTRREWEVGGGVQRRREKVESITELQVPLSSEFSHEVN